MARAKALKEDFHAYNHDKGRNTDPLQGLGGRTTNCFQPRPLSADVFEDQMFFLAQRGYRCIA